MVLTFFSCIGAGLNTVEFSVGATGHVTAPYLHWAVRVGDARVNGLDLVRLTSAPASGETTRP